MFSQYQEGVNGMEKQDQQFHSLLQQEFLPLTESLREPTSTALRYNSGKIEYALLPVDALEAEARVWMAGAKKYGAYNWEKLWGDQTIQVVLNSLLRHAYAIQRGEHRDLETGEPHAAHIRCNAAMLIRYLGQLEGFTK